MKMIYKVALLLPLFWSISSWAEDAGMITALSGTVQYQAVGSTKRPAVSFMKLRAGDRFSVASAATVRVVYFSSGRQENWKGPAEFTIGTAESVGGSQTPIVTALPIAASSQLSNLPDLSQSVQMSRLGGVTVRAGRHRGNPEEAAAVQKALEIRTSMVAAAPADELTADLYLLSVYIEYSRRDDITQLLDTMQAKRPGDESIRELRTHLVSEAR